jgi:transcriptional regulator with XRE-family HTH domain
MAPDLATILAAEAKARGLSGAKLAERADVPQTAAAAILRGQTADPRLSTLLALLGALGRDLAWLHRQGVRPPAPAET